MKRNATYTLQGTLVTQGTIAEAAETLNWKEDPMHVQRLEDVEAGKLRIGVAMDAAFCFYYEDNLDFLRELGAEIVYFPL